MSARAIHAGMKTPAVLATSRACEDITRPTATWPQLYYAQCHNSDQSKKLVSESETTPAVGLPSQRLTVTGTHTHRQDEMSSGAGRQTLRGNVAQELITRRTRMLSDPSVSKGVTANKWGQDAADARASTVTGCTEDASSMTTEDAVLEDASSAMTGGDQQRSRNKVEKRVRRQKYRNNGRADFANAERHEGTNVQDSLETDVLQDQNATLSARFLSSLATYQKFEREMSNGVARPINDIVIRVHRFTVDHISILRTIGKQQNLDQGPGCVQGVE
ncbi:hypothetical protein B0H11DRAFT_1904967 [Mycena galericulata]|nr:hypothetical protein B0H11DRAFT_1904967 [Mycena galericulata]